MTDYIISDNWLLELMSMHVSDARKREIRDTIFNKYPLSERLESTYHHGFNDGQVEGLPGDCIKCLEEDKTTMLEHDAKVAKAESDISKDLFEMLDNIDTASDIAKGDDKLYRSLISQEHTKRFKYANPDGSYRGIESLRSEP